MVNPRAGNGKTGYSGLGSSVASLIFLRCQLFLGNPYGTGVGGERNNGDRSLC